MEIGDWRPQTSSVAVKTAQFSEGGFDKKLARRQSRFYGWFLLLMVNFVQRSSCPITGHHCLFLLNRFAFSGTRCHKFSDKSKIAFYSLPFLVFAEWHNQVTPLNTNHLQLWFVVQLCGMFVDPKLQFDLTNEVFRTDQIQAFERDPFSVRGTNSLLSLEERHKVSYAKYTELPRRYSR